MNQRMRWYTALLLAGLLLFMSGCRKAPDYSRILVVTIEDSKVFLDEAMYFIWQMEEECKAYEELYRQQGQKDFWEQDTGEGILVRDAVKEDVLDNIIRNHILYTNAMYDGYSLSKEEEKECKNDAKILMQDLSGRLAEIKGLTAETLNRIKEEEVIVNRYYKDKTALFDLDREQVKAGIREEDYKQYDVETLSLFKEEEAYEKLEASLPEARAAGSLNELALDDKAVFIYEEFGFVPGQGACDPDIEAAAKELSNGETSGILETKESYVILRMVNNSSAEGYEDAVKSAVANAEYEAFEEFYNTLKGQYTIEVNHEVWDKIILGSTTNREDENGGVKGE